ncbi:divalent metal cation transporter [Sphingosinicella sp. YJ22]|uniref:NRAMP family divalent metal transporter n=1 Tax=Sphingosinicella sp. YJ22 TaxID=1104780 RepID=UPI00140D1DC9|nr:divalent metal cation transporter [Sphingosinicella sp. YJ22]
MDSPVAQGARRKARLRRSARPAVRFERLGPGLITGAADDDPSGIAAYSQAGAGFGLDMLWTMPVLYPLMSTMQMLSARIGRVTGKGLAANMKRAFPQWAVAILVSLLLIANIINIGADLAAMGASAALVTGLNEHPFTLFFAGASIALQLLVPYHRYVHFLKFLTLALFAYVGVVLTVRIDWGEVALRTIAPHLAVTRDAATTVVAVFGTTISPYLLFWQASQEVEDDRGDPSTGPLIRHHSEAPRQLARIRWDTLVGMGFANLTAFFIILSTAVTIHDAGGVELRTSAEAAEALRPIAGEFAFALFSLGIVGTGLLAVPVLAGSAAYAVSEALGWKWGLEYDVRHARGFYSIIAAAVCVGLAVDYSSLDPIRALFWSAVLNGLVSVPLMIAMMLIVSRRKIMGPFIASGGLRSLGWIATATMTAAAVAMLVMSLSPFLG